MGEQRGRNFHYFQMGFLRIGKGVVWGTLGGGRSGKGVGGVRRQNNFTFRFRRRLEYVYVRGL